MTATPMMKQYSSIKAKYKGAVLFFRMGDFFEMFYEDAKIANKVLGLTLTSRNHGAPENVPLAGFPHHQLEVYLSRMVKAGYKVAVCEQVEDPKLAQGVVKREVIEVVTAGSSLSDKVLEQDKNNYLAALCVEKDIFGLAYIDISTGEFAAGEGSLDSISQEIKYLNPSEILYPQSRENDIPPVLKGGGDPAKTVVDDFYFSSAYAEDTLKTHFNVISLRGLGFDNSPLAVKSAGAILVYLKEDLKRGCSQIRRLSMLAQREGMLLDPATIRNLEIFTSFSGRKEAALFHILDRASTAMGGRKMRRWLGRPLLKAEQISRRHDFVEYAVYDRDFRRNLRERLKNLCDIERTLSRLTGGRGNPRDALALRKSLEELPSIIELTGKTDSVWKNLGAQIDPAVDLTIRLQNALLDDVPFNVSEGGIFRPGYNSRLDQLRNVAGSGKEWIISKQEDERVRTGIPSLKISYNKVFGYYIEITKAHAQKVPPDYIRKQTLVNAERYITPELKEYEDQVLNAEDQIKDIEFELFNELKYTIAGFAETLQKDAEILAEADVYAAFAESAEEYGYIRPEIVDGDIIDLKDCRHPVIERLLPAGENFVPNDLKIGGDLRLMIITGPNMAGKSTYLRQVALNVLMAQSGSFIPAKSARIGTVDRIFTRVGAQDNLAEGESTFLLEMNEAANILNHATNKSLIVLDEIGRGTSTYDGLSIAWALTEYLHNTPRLRSKTLFATHYHELTELEKRLPGVRNFNILVQEHQNRVIFLRKIAPGGCDRSYGIQVARMAGLPESLIDRALEVLATLETLTNGRIFRKTPPPDHQINLFKAPAKDDLRERLASVNPDELSPKQALEILYELKKM